MREPAARLRAAMVAVVRSALAARGARRVALLDDGSPEAELARGWLVEGLGEEGVLRVAAQPELEPLLHAARALAPGREAAASEVLRLVARLAPDAVTACPANKTALLLGGPLPPERLFPLGDVWASQVQVLCGGWSAPAAVARLAERAGGVQVLDAALQPWLEGRDFRGLEALGPELAEEVRARFASGRADRLHPLVVPKLTSRTLGVDLFE